jgi:hypothetical protein
VDEYAAAFGTIGSIPETLTWHRVHDSNSSRNITSIKDKGERNEQLRQQCVYFMKHSSIKHIDRIAKKIIGRVYLILKR